MRHRLLLLVLIVLITSASLIALWAGGWLDFATVKGHHKQLEALVKTWPLPSAMVFFVCFVLATVWLYGGAAIGVFCQHDWCNAGYAIGPLCAA